MEGILLVETGLVGEIVFPGWLKKEVEVEKQKLGFFLCSVT